MNVDLWINDEKITKEIDGDAMLLDFLRDHGCLSVKRGCETSNCGLCTVIMDDKPVLSCSTLVARAAGKHIYTLEGLQAEAQAFGECLADQGAEQCGFCNPGLVLTVLAMVRELKHPSDAQINDYLSGNLCRCSGYMGQLRGIRDYLQKKGGEKK